MHRLQQAAGIFIKLSRKTMQQRFQRRDQQGEGRPQLMADISKEPALCLVEFHEFTITLLELLTVLIQFMTQRELAKPQSIEKVIASHHDRSGTENKIGIVYRHAQIVEVVVQNART